MNIYNTNSKQIIDLSIQHKTMKSLEAKTGDNLGDPEFDNDFSDTTPKS